MDEEMKSELVSAAKPVAVWLQERGLDFACDVIAAVIIFIMGMFAIRLLTLVLRRLFARRMGSRELLAKFLLSVVTKCAWAFLAVIVLEKLGVAVAPLIAGLGVTGFILGFAFQESLASLAAGIMLAIHEPFKIGDTVVIAGHEGVVKKLDMMAVILETKDNRTVTIPNKQAWGAAIVRFGEKESCA